MSRDEAHLALADHVAALDDLAARPSLAAAIEARRAGAALAEALNVDPDERLELMAALERLMLRLFGEGPGELQACIELGASSARHIRILEPEYWETFRLGEPFPERPFDSVLDAIRRLHGAARPADEEWRTPHERGESAAACSAYELQQFAASVIHLKETGALAAP